MRRLIVMRGPPGSGKTTLLTQAGLQPFSLSQDALRALVSGPVLNRQGVFSVSQDENEWVYSLFTRVASERMARGELLVLDTTAQGSGDLQSLLALARTHRYQVAVVDLSSVPVEQTKAQNANRPALQRVSDMVIERAYERLGQQGPVPADVALIRWAADGSHLSQLDAFLDTPVRDLSAYRAVVHVGDVQGCFAPLAGPGGVLEQGLQDDTFYVFVGDFVDRGPDNARVVRWLLDHAVGRPNVALLWGNHEDHLDRYARGQPPVSPEFRERTEPQLVAEGITPAEVERLCAHIGEALAYQFGDHRVLVTHSGLPTVPQRLAEVSLYQLSHGTGAWADPVDDQFERLAPEGWVQVHGHRNHGWQPIQANPRSFNLEGSVERGGDLRVATLDASGWSVQSVRNRDFVPHRARLKSVFEREGVPSWMDRPDETVLSSDVLEAMRAHPGVKEKTSARSPHIASLNFTKKVFYDQSWDDVVVKARGLFFDTESGVIAARSYEKFFNVNERGRPENQMAALANMSWPVTAYVKENGFLGLVGIDPRTQDLFLASKSTPDGDFAGWFRDIFHAAVPEATQEGLRRWLVDHEASLAVEVNDPVRDPHMIDYDQPHLVILDVFHRSTVAEKLPHDDLVRFCKKFGLTPKERGMVFPDFEAFSGWHRAASKDLTHRHRGRDIEGYVLEDRKGFQTKVKLPHYAFWKRMRSAKDRMGRLKEQGALTQTSLEARLLRGETAVREHQEVERTRREVALLLRRDPHPLARAFLTWADAQPVGRLTGSILALRRGFHEEVPADPTWLTTPWAGFDDGDASEVEHEPAPRAARHRH